MAGDGEFAIDLATRAIADCLAGSRHDPGDIDLLISCNISRIDGPNARVTFEPSTSVRLQQRFGLNGVLAFDISNACAGMFTAVLIADAFFKAGASKCALIVSGEYITPIAFTAQRVIDGDFDPRLGCLTVGDAGAALLLEPATGGAGFHGIDIFTLGRYSTQCIAQVVDAGPIMLADLTRMTEVALPPTIAAYLELQSRLPFPLSIDHVILHQTSRSTLREAGRALTKLGPGYGKGKIVDNLTDRGNTASTSQFVAVMDQIVAGQIRTGDNVLFAINGSGQTVGAALYTFDDLPERVRHRRMAERIAPRTAAYRTPSRPASGERVRIESIGTTVIGVERRPSVELATSAAEDCLRRSRYERRDIGLLLYSGVYRTDFVVEPAIAALVIGELRINDTFESPPQKRSLAFDVFNGGVGFLNACHLATRLIQSQRFGTALVMASEIENNAASPAGRRRGVAEAASAVILDRHVDGTSGFGGFLFRAFIDHLEAVQAYASVETGACQLHVREAPDVEAAYLACIPGVVNELLELENLDMSRIKIVLPPQRSSAFIAQLAERLGVGRDHCLDSTVPGSDLFTSSIPYALREVESRGLVSPGDLGLLISVGSGIQVGCAIYHF